MLTIRQAIALGIKTLAMVPDPELDSVSLLSEVTGDAPMAVRLKAQECLTPKQEERFRSLLLLRATRRPLQYVLGVQCFYGFDFVVDERVLIPRQETETLCELALQATEKLTAPAVLDVCAGSGALAVTIKRLRPSARVVAVDISGDALALARENARRNQADVAFLQGDLLAPVQGQRFDLIVSNPPYIATAACDTLQPEVRFEPRLALDGGADGLDFYRRLARQAPDRLCQNGYLMVEVGDDQAADVAGIFRDTGMLAHVAIHRDLYGKDRFVTAQRAAFPT